MWKIFFIYPFVFSAMVWLTSDVDLNVSLYSIDDNYLIIEFPKAGFRSNDHSDPWYSFYWNVESAQNELQKINDAIVK